MNINVLHMLKILRSKQIKANYNYNVSHNQVSTGNAEFKKLTIGAVALGNLKIKSINWVF